MECSRCCLQPVIHAFTQANLDNSLGRMKTKEIIAAVNNLKVVFKDVCVKCHGLPSKTNSLVEDLRNVWNERFNTLAASIKEDAENLRPLINELREAFQVVCLTCSNVSNDDNPSNHGQTFVSLDSGNCQADSGRARTTHTDDNIVQSRADWIGLHRSPDVEEQTFGMSPVANIMLNEDRAAMNKLLNETSSMLPPEVEDRLRHEFSNFVELDIIDKLLLSCVMSGMNIAEFAKMLWFPYSIVDPKTRIVKAITKQAAHARWINICKRFPVFMSIAVSTTKDDKKARERLRKFIDEPNGTEPDNKFLNGKVSAMYAKAAQKAKAEAEKKRLAKERSNQKRDEALRLAREKAKAEKLAEKQKAKAEKKRLEKLRKSKKAFPTRKEDCLPGLF